MAKSRTTGKSDSGASAPRTPRRKRGDTAPELSRDDIRRKIEQRAHDLYLARRASGEAGDPQHDWFAAEAEIREKYGSA